MPPEPARRKHPLLGRKLAGRFLIESFLGEGGMAAVFRGLDEKAGYPVAIKVMNPGLAGDATFAKRFKREATASAKLRHPNCVDILAHGVDGTTVFMVMELLVGQDLASLLSKERRVPEARAAKIVAQICDALALAHGEGIIHRDLKPENIFLLPGEDGGDHVKVLDFGIAKLLDAEPPEEGEEPPSSTRQQLTRAGTLIGTPEYMSPEQCKAEAVDPRSDVYSCGVLLFQLVTSVVPFVGETALDIMRRHVNEAPRRPSVLVPTVHPRLDAAIVRALSKARGDRHQSARELGDELLALLPELSGARLPSSPNYEGPPSDVAATIRRPTLEDDDSDRQKTLVRPGSAVDASGNALVVEAPVIVDATPAVVALPRAPLSSDPVTLRSGSPTLVMTPGDDPERAARVRPALWVLAGLGGGLLAILVVIVLFLLVSR